MARSYPGRAGQQEPPNSALPPAVMSKKACGLRGERVEQRRDEARPRAARARACWVQSAIIPATSGVAALVPPTNAMPWPLRAGSPARRAEQTIG